MNRSRIIAEVILQMIARICHAFSFVGSETLTAGGSNDINCRRLWFGTSLGTDHDSVRVDWSVTFEPTPTIAKVAPDKDRREGDEQ